MTAAADALSQRWREMGNRDMAQQMFSFEKARKMVNARLYFGSSGAVTLDAQGSKGVLAATKVSTPSQNGTYTINFGVSVNGISYRDSYVKLLGLSALFEVGYSGNANAAAPIVEVFQDDTRNGVPSFGDVAPVQAAVTSTGSDGSFAGGQAFKWIVTAVDAVGNETALPTAVAQEQSATPGASEHAVISWTAVTGASSYNVYRTAAAGGSGAELVFVGNTTAVTLNDLGTAGTGAYQGGSTTLASGGKKIPNSQLPAYNFARPPFGYNSVTVGFYANTTLTNPAAGEAVRLQFSFGDSDAP